MTREEAVAKFNAQLGAEFRTFQRTPLFDGIISVLEACSPARATCGLSAQAMTDYAPATLGNIAGYYSPIDILLNVLGKQMESTTEESTFSKSHEQLYQEEFQAQQPQIIQARKTRKKP